MTISKNDETTAKNIDFNQFKIGTLFLIRTPETFPEGYPEKALSDMKSLGMDYIAWLETWNCQDGILWKNPKYPRSSFWENNARDPLEETFSAADESGLAFLPEAGVMHRDFFESHQDEASPRTADGKSIGKYGRIGLVPSAPVTLDYFIDKYETLIEQFRHHKSFQGICLPAENGVIITWDKYTLNAYAKKTGESFPSPQALKNDYNTYLRVFRFMEAELADFMRKLASHIKGKYQLKIMHYPLGILSAQSHFIPKCNGLTTGIDCLKKVKEIDILNLQIHPTLDDNPYYFKAETEIIQALCRDIPCVADTHYYHELCAGRLPSATPKRFRDWIFSTLTPHGISFFCSGFFEEELPEWKTMVNPGAKVFKAYSDPDIVHARRKQFVKAIAAARKIGCFLTNTRHEADCAVYYDRRIVEKYRWGNYEKLHLFGLYETFQAAAVPVKFLTSIPQGGSGCKSLFLHNPDKTDDSMAKELQEYVKAGGILILSGRASSSVAEIFALDLKPAASECVVLSLSDGTALMMPCCSETNLSAAIGKTIYRWDNGYPCVSELKIGKGKLIYIGAGAVFSNFSNHRDFSAIKFFKEIVKIANGDLEVDISAPYLKHSKHIYLSSDIYQGTDKKLLMIRNFGVEAENVSCEWNIKFSPDKLNFYIDDQELPLQYSLNGHLMSVKLPLIEDIAIIAARIVWT